MLADATGQSTNWGKFMRDYLSSDYTIDDAFVSAL